MRSLCSIATAPSEHPELRRDPEEALGAILELLGSGRLDFRGIPAWVVRHSAERRREQHGIGSMWDYLSLLRWSPTELRQLQAALLGGRSHALFQGPTMWDFVGRHIVPRLRTDRTRRCVRAWVTRCGRGAEAYALAMMLLEHASATGSGHAVQVFASDVDDQLLAFAGGGPLPPMAVRDVGPARLARFFIEVEGGYQVRNELRQAVTFAQHDLFVDFPFSHLDLIVCRGVLPYLRPAARS